MVPTKHWAAVCLTLALLAFPGFAGAAVESFVDEQGTLHITNLGPYSPGGKKPPGPPAQKPGKPQEPPPPAVGEPPPDVPEEAPPPLPPEAEQPEESHSVAPAKIQPTVGPGGEIRLTNLPVPPAVKSGPPSDSARVGALARGEERKPAASRSEAWAASPVTVEPRFRPPVRQGLPVAKYTDDGGTVHITTHPAAWQQELMRLAGYEWPAGLPRASTPASSISLIASARKTVPREVAKKAEAIAASAPAAKGGSGESGPQTLKRFRDRKGVWHIVSSPNVRAGAKLLGKPEPRLPTPPALAAAPLPVAGASGSFGHLPADTMVTVRRDAAGRLCISNAPRPRKTSFAGSGAAMREAVRPLAVQAAQAYGLPVSLVEAVIQVESNFSPQAISPKGAMGLMQLMPGTARDLGVQNPFCPRENIFAGSRYLRLLLNLFHQDLGLALAAYNAGFQRVIDCGFQVPPIKETQGFVTQVLKQYYRREGLPVPDGDGRT